MKIEDQYSSRERLETEALEDSDKIPRLTIFEDTGTGWQLSKSLVWLKNILGKLNG
jgi:hypothetical protein